MTDLIKIFNKVIKSKPVHYNPKALPSISPSSIGSSCLRKAYFDYARTPKETTMPIKADRILKLGTIIGDHIIDTFRQSNILKVIDYVMEDGSIQMAFKKPCLEFPIKSKMLECRKGFIDMVFIDDEKLQLAEFKSINSDGYAKLRKPIQKHMIQSVIYIHIFNNLLKTGAYNHIKSLKGFSQVTDIHLLYYCKNSSYLRCFTLSNTAHIFKEIIGKILAVKSVAQSKILPPTTEDYCNTCFYAKRCESNLLAPRDGGSI